MKKGITTHDLQSDSTMHDSLTADNQNQQRRHFLKGALTFSAGVIASSSLPTTMARASHTNRQNNITAKNWMSAVASNKYLSDLTLPATHDSAANLGSALVRTQELSIREQLDVGVRYLDLRICLTGNAETGEFRMYHGPIDLGKSFIEVLTSIKQFLQSQPTETVMICLKQENSSFDDPTMGRAYMRHIEKFRDMIIDTYSMSTLGEARGKMVVVTRCLGIPGILYRRAKVLDNYKIQTRGQWYSRKWPAVKEHLFAARDAEEGNGVLWITTTSSTGSFLWPVSASRLMLPALASFFDDLKHVLREDKARFGVVIVDFATPTIVDKIAALNFNKPQLARV